MSGLHTVAQPRAATPSSLRAYLRPYRTRVGVGLGLLLVTNALDKVIPWMLRHAVDALHVGHLRKVTQFALAVLALALSMWVIRTWSRVQVFNIGRDIEFDLRNDLLRAVHRLGRTFFSRMPTGEVMSRATNDLGQIRMLLGFGLLNVANSVMAYVGALAFMFAISPRLSVYALIPYPFFALLARAFARSIYRLSGKSQEALGKLSAIAQENLAGVRVVRAFSLEAFEEERFERANQNALRATMRLVIVRGIMWPVLMMMGSLGTLIVIWVGGTMVLRDELTVGEFAAFNAYLGQLVWPTLALGYTLSVVQRGRASFQRVAEILDAAPSICDAPDAVATTGAGLLEVSGLSYSYGDRTVLSDVSFRAEPGKKLAILGKTGSGKSTLSALLPRLLPTPPGTVRLDGQDVTHITLASLRKEIGYSPQEPFLFSTTVARNMGFALQDPDSEASMAQMERVAREIQIFDEIQAMPDGWNTPVGERGVQLSGGQKQRVALARALLNDPRVLVLDDPLSAVDAKTESAILDALDRAGEGRTVILVTNRVAAAARSDQVIVLDEGRVIEEGTHEQLLRRGGVYAELARRQQLEHELEVA